MLDDLAVPVPAASAAIVVVHAGGFSAACYDALARVLGRPTVGVDLPGHGVARQASPPGPVIPWSSYAAALAQALARLEEPPILLGHSLGATTAILALAREGVRARALVAFEPILIDATNDLERERTDRLVAQALRRRDHFADRDAAARRLGSKPPMSAFAPGVLRAYVETCLVDDPGGGVRLRLAPAEEAAMYRGGLEAKATELLATLTVPTLILAGERSDTVTSRDLERWQALVPGLVTQVVEGVGHFGPFENPHRVAAAITTWLDARWPPAR